MKLTSILSVAGLSSVAVPVIAHGDHGSMTIAQLAGHVLTGEHSLFTLVVVAASFLIFGRVAKRS